MPPNHCSFWDIGHYLKKKNWSKRQSPMCQEGQYKKKKSRCCFLMNDPQYVSPGHFTYSLLPQSQCQNLVDFLVHDFPILPMPPLLHDVAHFRACISLDPRWSLLHADRCTPADCWLQISLDCMVVTLFPVWASPKTLQSKPWDLEFSFSTMRTGQGQLYLCWSERLILLEKERRKKNTQTDTHTQTDRHTHTRTHTHTHAKHNFLKPSKFSAETRSKGQDWRRKWLSP